MTERDPRPASRRPRPPLVRALLLVLQVLTACVVVREERPSAPVAPEGGDIPDAEPLALEPASDRRLPGSLGWALLGSQVTEAVLEVNHAGDTRLSEEALSALEANLVEHGGKATVRRVVRRELPVQEVYSPDDLRSLAAQRDHSSGNGTVSVQVLVLPGRFEVEGVPGAAFEATSFAVFPDQSAGACRPGRTSPPSRRRRSCTSWATSSG